MPKGELFSDLREYREPLSVDQRKSAVSEILRNIGCGEKYFYSLKEACSVLHISYDEMNSLIKFYLLDVVTIRDAYRVPWWSLAEYLLDESDSMEEELNECLRSKHR